MPGIKHLFGGFDNRANRHFAHDDIHLHFRQKVHIDFRAAVELGSPHLHTAAEYIRHRHACDTDAL
ncbi:hypothetical protein SDC9_140512 [bioreactor metagenome]|uniref:Uncharacterized protein n=1 Tax=bioreactor metagenome TaxID=1076179 RepID=A0A645DVQ4_9ZZZZ